MTAWSADAFGMVSAGASVLMVLVGIRRSALRRRSRARLDPADADDPPGPRRRLLLVLPAVVGGVLVLGWVRSSLLAGFAVVAWWARAAQHRRRADLALSRELPEVLDALVGAVRSGGSLLEGMAAARAQPFEPSVRHDLGLVLAEVDRGGDLITALAGWADRRDDRDLRTVAGVAAAATTTGGPLAAALARIAASIRHRQALDREVEALVGQARLSAMVLVVLPIGVLPLLDVLGAVRIEEVLTDPVSRVAIAGGIGLDLIGLVWMRRLVARIQS